MNTLEIEAFLAVVRYSNISNASQQLFMSQSTISQRIKNLESKLEVRLLERSKGISSIKLTKQGENFYKIALKWEQLTTDAKMLKQEQYSQNISIAGVDSINNFVLNDALREMVLRNPQVSYFFRTHQSDEIYSLVEKNSVDIGFILQERVSETVVKEEFFREDLILVLNRNSDISKTFTLHSLDPKKELYINWGHDFGIWREKRFGYSGTLGIEVHTGVLIEEFLKSEDHWAIVPVSMAKRFVENSSLHLFHFKEGNPHRTCHLIYDRNNENIHHTYKNVMDVKNLIDNKIVLNSNEITKEI